jgi:hypothetical protein
MGVGGGAEKIYRAKVRARRRSSVTILQLIRPRMAAGVPLMREISQMRVRTGDFLAMPPNYAVTRCEIDSVRVVNRCWEDSLYGPMTRATSQPLHPSLRMWPMVTG